MAARRTRAALRALAAALLLSCADSTGPGKYANGDPARAELVTSDLVNFYRAYDSGVWIPAAFESEYLGRASPGLREFARKRSVTALDISRVVVRYPRYFASTRKPLLDLAAGIGPVPKIRADFERLERLYPAAVFPPVTFLVGKFSSGGTIGSEGLFIGAEFYALTQDAPIYELGHFERMNIHRIDSLPFIVAHELTHVQQAQAGSRASLGTLLDQALMEGSADFVGEIVSGGIVNGRLHDWALPREPEVWADFRDEMHGRDVSRWLYNQSAETLDRPGDLGYFVGYRIAAAYYARAADKTAALRDIIRVKDARALLAASGYDPR